MPRKAPNQIIEHRLSLQDAERNALLPIFNDVQKFTKSARIASQVATYGGLTLAAVGLYIVPKIWQETTEKINDVASALNPLSYPERFVDYFEARKIPTGIFGDFIKNRL